MAYTNREIKMDLTTLQNYGQAMMDESIKPNFARQDGFYEKLTSGTALNLQGNDTATNMSAFRTSGGDADIATGTANIEAIAGNTIEWNQHIVDEDISGTTTQGSSTYLSKSLSTNSYVFKNRCCFVHGEVTVTNAGGKSSNVQVDNTNISTIPIKSNNDTINIAAIGKVNTDNWHEFRFYISSLTSNQGVTISWNDIKVIDLTSIYGKDREAYGLGVQNLDTDANKAAAIARFESDYRAWFGKDLNYEPYNAGTILSVTMSGINTVGFNQYSNSLGYMRVIGGMKYQITGAYTQLTFAESFDDTRGVVVTPTTMNTGQGGQELSPYDGLVFEKDGYLFVEGGDSTTCIHFVWSGYKNGDTEEYWSDFVQIPVTNITGKVNGEGDSVYIFGKGMNSVEIKQLLYTLDDERTFIRDTIYATSNGETVATKRTNTCDLKSLRWRVSNSMFGANIPDVAHFSHNEIPNAIVSNIYDIIPYSLLNHNDKVISFDESLVYIKDSSITDLRQLEEYLLENNIRLCYEIYEPINYIVDNFELPVNFKVDDFGTEAITNEEGIDGIAPVLTVKYAMNAVDTLRNLDKHYVSATESQNFTANEKQTARDNIDAPNKNGNYSGMTVGNADFAGNLSSWEARGTLSTDDTWDDVVRTSAGDVSIDSSMGAKLLSITAKSDFAATDFRTSRFNLLSDATSVGLGWYMLVPKLTFGAYGSSSENNGILFTDSDGNNLNPTVYFKPIVSGTPTSITDGTQLTEQSTLSTANENGGIYTSNGHKFYLTPGVGYLIVSSIDRNSVCAHLGWSRRYDDYEALDISTTGRDVALTTTINAIHSDVKQMLVIGTGANTIGDWIEFLGTTATWHRKVGLVTVNASGGSGTKWSDRTDPVEEGETQTYTHYVDLGATFKNGGAAEIYGTGLVLDVNGTVVSYQDTSATASQSKVKFEYLTESTGITNVNNSVSIEDWGLEMLVDASGSAEVKTEYSQNYPDSVAGMLNKMDEVYIPVISNAFASLYAEIRGLRSMLMDKWNRADLQVSTLDAENIKIGGNDWIVKASGAPTTPPRFIGQEYLDTTNNKLYVAFRLTNSTNDWIKIN